MSPSEAKEPVDIVVHDAAFLIAAPGIMIWLVKSPIVDIFEKNIWQVFIIKMRLTTLHDSYSSW